MEKLLIQLYTSSNGDRLAYAVVDFVIRYPQHDETAAEMNRLDAQDRRCFREKWKKSTEYPLPSVLSIEFILPKKLPRFTLTKGNWDKVHREIEKAVKSFKETAVQITFLDYLSNLD